MQKDGIPRTQEPLSLSHRSPSSSPASRFIHAPRRRRRVKRRSPVGGGGGGGEEEETGRDNDDDGGGRSGGDVELLGGARSYPPRCVSKCGVCTPCKPVHVAVPPGRPVIAEYYPEAWRCKCGGKLYIP
ncbi:unnamed protein product [Spirodela intermedia]|uniref:Epidermal patterning factor-like protein n=1 Tax=Spirodela intermedia TaxID=51605 RepID=A0A7I8IVR1_SPIIN|nr:unnamed protein product [Spirodela intermedia]CAA6661870.1 unnamed protein product [Spirodela intermedia]